MNFNFANKINPDLQQLDFKKAIDIAEKELKKIPPTEFHEVLGKTLTDQAEELSEWVEGFYQVVSKKIDIKALYFEMNEFDINTDYWYIDSFAFSEDGGYDLDDMEWLCDFQAHNRSEIETTFVIEGYEKLQSAFESIELSNDNLQNARDWCEQIIIARYMELMRSAHLLAKQKNYGWASIPIYFTEHEYDFILKSTN